MKSNFFISALVMIALIFACEDSPENRKKPEKEPQVQKGGQHTNEEKKNPELEKDLSEGANAHMHQRSVEELIERFESEERDAYQQPEKVLNYLGNLKGKKVVDIGAGSGYFSVKLARRGAEVIAADVDKDFQDYLRLRITEEGLEDQVETRIIPYDNPELAPAEVDMALIVNTYHHIEDRVDYFSKVKTGLKEGGEVVIVDFFKVEAPVGPPVDHKLSMDVVIDELKKVGYENIQAEVSLLPYQYIIRAQ